MVKDNDGLDWAAEPVRVRYTFRIGGQPISPVPAIKRSKIANIPTDTVRRETTSRDNI